MKRNRTATARAAFTAALLMCLPFAAAAADTGSRWLDSAVRKLAGEMVVRNALEDQGHGFLARYGYSHPELVAKQLFGDEAFMIEITNLEMTALLQKFAAWEPQE